MPKMRLPPGVDPKSIGVHDLAVGGMVSGPVAVRRALGGLTGPKSMETLKRLTEVFRPKDLSKVLPEEHFISKIPAAPNTAEKIDASFYIYLDEIARILGMK